MKRLLFILLALFPFLAFSQSKFELSEDLKLPHDGWNKLLQMKSGNTLLFHFENRKGIVVRVFDKDHKEIAKEKHLCNVLDINAFDRSFYKGLFEVDGEGVLFISQNIDNKYNMVRLRINGNTAKLIKEESIVTAPNALSKFTTSVVRSEDAGTYSVVSFNEKSTNEAAGKLQLTIYGNKHEVLADLPVEMPNADYDYISYLGGSIDKNGSVLLATELSKIIQYPDVLDNDIIFYYLPKGGREFLVKKIGIPRGSIPNLKVSYTYNPFVNNINIFVHNKWEGRVKYGNVMRKGLYSSYVLTIASDSLRDILGNRRIEYTKAKEYLHNHANPQRDYYGMPFHIYTDNVGMTSIVSIEEDVDSTGLYFPGLQEQTNNNIGVTMYNDYGDEIWGAVLPYQNLSSKNDAAKVFGLCSENELSDLQCVNKGRNCYVFFNEPNDNHSNLVITDTIDSKYKLKDRKYTYDLTNATYYKIDAKKNITKEYLLNAPVEGEYNHIYAASGGFDEASSTYVTLVECKKDGKTTNRIAWCHL